MVDKPAVRCGLDVLTRQDFAPLRGLRVGLVTHPAAVSAELRHSVDVLSNAPGVHLAVLFGPEHGFAGQAQDLIGVGDSQDRARGLRIHSLYGDSIESLRPTDEQLAGLDALVIDLQDVGSRYYTFQATMLFCLETAARRGMLTVVLDRPNPIGGEQVEGPALHHGFESFVGVHPIAIRHGLTIGELARLYKSERNFAGELVVIPCEGWRRSMDFEQTGLPWVLPSPNMPTLETAYVYPGQCLLEGTNLSEGRGTTRPFELCGAPWLDPERLAQRMNAENLPGVKFRATTFRPTFHKFAGQTCGGVQLHVADRRAYQPVRTSLALLAAMRELSGSRFAWRTEAYEFVADRPAIDLLFGSDRERRALEESQAWPTIAASWVAEETEFLRRRRPFLAYE